MEKIRVALFLSLLGWGCGRGAPVPPVTLDPPPVMNPPGPDEAPTPPDAGVPDAGEPDAGFVSDAGPPDAGPPDAGTPPWQVVAGAYVGDLHEQWYFNREVYDGGFPLDIDRRWPMIDFVFFADASNALTLRGITVAIYAPFVFCGPIPVEARDDGVLVFPPLTGCFISPPSCPGETRIQGGTGTWNYSGQVSFVIQFTYSNCANPDLGHGTLTLTNGQKQR